MIRHLLVLAAGLATSGAGVADAPAAASAPSAAASASLPRSMPGCGRLVYPRAAVHARETGITRLQFEVSETGEVTAMRLLESAGSARLDDAAIAALKTCHFAPARDAQGRAIASATTLEYVWKIDPAPADSLATASIDHVAFTGATALLPHMREPVLRKIQQYGGEVDDCFDIVRVDSRPLPDGYALPVDRDTDARELWVAHQCGIARAYVVTLRRHAFSNEIRVWPAGRAAADGTVAPLPAAADVTDARVRAEYERARTLAGSEYHARQILVPSREQAQLALDRIRAGEPFAQVAERMSVDPASAAKGGELGWVGDRRFTAPFAAALRSLAPHGLSRAPVRTADGWHVIEVLDARPAPYPGYDAVKDKLEATLRSRATDGL